MLTFVNQKMLSLNKSSKAKNNEILTRLEAFKILGFIRFSKAIKRSAYKKGEGGFDLISFGIYNVLEQRVNARKLEGGGITKGALVKW